MAATPKFVSSPARLALAALLAAGLGFAAVTRPLTAPLDATVEMADMTWVEIRSALERGYDTVIVPSGGIEQNGPHMVTGKHQHIVALAARLIAERRGRTLVAPVVAYVPEGDYDPPSGNMKFPGTLGVPAPVFAATLEGIARSLKSAGFKRIVFIADHGESQAPQEAAAEKLSREWVASGVRVLALGDYYRNGDAAQQAHLKALGHAPAAIGDHAGLQDTAELMAAHPAGVKLERLARLIPSFEADGSSGAPARATPDLGRQLIDLKVKAALDQLDAAGI
jgi:creatinine amidohydrolase/Fe(II)-dependent formamide hydrolase-like protein